MARATTMGCILVGLLLGGRSLAAQRPGQIDFTQVTRPVVEIDEPALIEYLLFELFIEPVEPPTRIQVIDVTENGYGPDDVIIVYPTVEAFLIPELLPDSVQTVMSQWAPEVEFRLDAGNLPSEALAGLIANAADTTKRAESAIMYDVVQAVERNYRDLPVGILFERDSLGFTFQIWDYNRSAMRYVPRAAFSPDSAVSSVLSSLEDIGYLPGQDNGSPAASRAPNRLTRRVASLNQAIIGIRSLPEEQVRYLAAKTILLGSFDFDRSGSIDQAEEIDAVSCDVWVALGGTFPELLDRFGFLDQRVRYSGGVFFSISERVRMPAGRRGQACMDGRVPPPTSEEDLGAVASAEPLPPSVEEYIALDLAALIVAEAGGRERGSADWAAVIRDLLLAQYDTDGSDALDVGTEIIAVPCVVWRAIHSTHDDFVADLGFDGATTFAGDSIGIDFQQRDFARSRIEACARGEDSTIPTRVRRTRVSTGLRRPSPGYSPVRALESVRSFSIEDRQRGARTILLSAYDLNSSGYIDLAEELDAVSCDMWRALDATFPGFATDYGFTDTPNGVSQFRGNLVFNISRQLREPAIRRFTACLAGQPPPPTDPSTIDTDDESIALPASLRDFMDAQTATRIARDTDALAPGSADWAAVVRSVLLDTYDLDHSGFIDFPEEVDEVPCVVWTTVRSTFGASLTGLGFADSDGVYFGDRIGIAAEQRVRAGQRITTCGA